jgi:tetratricopeptide (TPR) repeat protein
LTYGELINAAMAGIPTTGLHQTPLLIGNREQLIFGEEDPYLSLFEFSEGWSRGPSTQERLTERYARVCSKLNAPFPQAHLAFARAFLRKGDYSAAARALATAVSQGAGAEAVIAAAVAQVRMGESPEAVANLQKAALLATSEPSLVAVHLARMLLALGDIDTAVRILRAAVEADKLMPRRTRIFILGSGTSARTVSKRHESLLNLFWPKGITRMKPRS